jgi:flotillin
MALGMGRTAEVKRDARIGEAQAKSDAQIKEAIAEEQRMASRLENDIQIAKAQRDFEVKKAAYDKEVNAKVKWRIAKPLNKPFHEAIK